MRLSDRERAAIRKTVTEIDPRARTFLFGSRTDDSKKGGDIDLLIISDFLGRAGKRTIRFRLWDMPGDGRTLGRRMGGMEDRLREMGGIPGRWDLSVPR